MNYNDPIIFNWHIDPQSGEKYSVQITDESQTVIKNRIFLNQIPDKLRGVEINGLTEKTNIDSENDFIVDYSNGSIAFHPSKENSQFSISYYGRGVVMYPASRIWTELGNMGQVQETLQDVIGSVSSVQTGLQTLINSASRTHTDLEEVISLGNLDNYVTTVTLDNRLNNLPSGIKVVDKMTDTTDSGLYIVLEE